MKLINMQQKQNEDIILRFDEVLTEKASKLSVDSIFKLTKDNIDTKGIKLTVNIKVKIFKIY